MFDLEGVVECGRVASLERAIPSVEGVMMVGVGEWMDG